MATKTQLGGVFMKDTDGNIASGAGVSSENVCGLIFDTAGATVNLSSTKFANGNVIEFNSTKEIKEAGLTEELMFGLPYYHVKSFFDVAGQNKRLFVSFMDSSVDTEFNAVELMQTAADGIIYQIGVWTASNAIAVTGEGEQKEIKPTNLYKKLQNVAETLGGKIGEVNYDGNSPISIILNASVAREETEFDYTKLPDISSLECPKVTYILGQASTDDVHQIQAKLAAGFGTEGHNVVVPVGNVGAALGVLAVAPAEVCIARTRDFNLAGVMTSCELGFGDVTVKAQEGTTPATVTGSALNNLKSITYTKRNNYLHKKGYVFLTPIEGIQNGVFFSSDQTLSTGDYRTIARCRVMHKSRRLVRNALLTKVNDTVMLDTATGQMSSADITEYKNLVLNAINDGMKEPGTNVVQISGSTCDIDPEQNILVDDAIRVEYSIVPVGCTSAIYVTEGFAGSISE